MVSYCGNLGSHTAKCGIAQPSRLLEPDLPARENTEGWQPHPSGTSIASGVELVQPLEFKLIWIWQSTSHQGRGQTGAVSCFSQSWPWPSQQSERDIMRHRGRVGEEALPRVQGNSHWVEGTKQPQQEGVSGELRGRDAFGLIVFFVCVREYQYQGIFTF